MGGAHRSPRPHRKIGKDGGIARFHFCHTRLAGLDGSCQIRLSQVATHALPLQRIGEFETKLYVGFFLVRQFEKSPGSADFPASGFQAFAP